MAALFLTILNMSLTGAFVIAVICLARQLLKKAPKAISYVLWAVVGFRLVFPFTFESFFSLIRFNPAPIPLDIATQPIPRINSGIPIINNAVNNAVNNALPVAEPFYSVNPLQIWIAIGAWAWFIVAISLMIYGVASFFIIKHKMRNATWIESNIYEADKIKSPFVLGVFSPKIYLPVGLFEQERGYILLHEQTHIRRCDHIVKFAAYFILCLHWFNPFSWAAFWLMGADMEMSCDERVMKELGDDISKDYSMSLVRIATGRRIIAGSPLAFGEGGIKERVKRVLNFKKPTRVIIVAAAILAVALSAGFAVNHSPVSSLADDELFTMEIVYVDNPASFLRDMKLIFGDTVYHATPLTDVQRGRLLGFAYDEYSTWRVYEIEGRSQAYLLAVESDDVWRVMSSNPPELPWRQYILENATDRQRFERMLSVTLNHDGSATLAIPPISSFMLIQPLFYTFSNGELLIQSEDGNVIARFEEFDESTIIFRGATVPLFADEGARYVIYTSNEMSSGILTSDMLSQIYLGMTNEAVFALFGEPDFHASGLVWYGYNDIGIFDPTASTTGVVERISLQNGISWSVSELINTAVKQHFAGHFYAPEGSFSTEAHTVLALDANPQGFTAYVVSLYMNYLPDGDTVREISGGHSHLVLTFARNQNNQYELVEFWEPEKGMNHMESIRSRFPENTWGMVDAQLYIQAHTRRTHEQAMRFFFGEQTNFERTARNTLYEALFSIFEAVYDFDYALNTDIRYIAVDTSGVFDDMREPLLASLEAWCESKGYELLADASFDGLVEVGLILPLPDTSGFRTGILFSFSDASFDGETLTVSASKWRSPRGATGSEFTAKFSEGDWIIENSGWWMS